MEQLIKKASKKLDDHFDFKNIIGGLIGTGVEIFDKSIFEAALTFIESKLPEEFKDEFEVVLQAVVDENYSAITSEALSFINSKLDIPYLDEEDEAIVLGAIAKAITAILQKKKIISTPVNLDDTVGGGGPAGDPDGNDEEDGD